MTVNPHIFKFKQFEVLQEQSAMKVGTDGVLLGAWAPISQARNILDIGTGTGLIALMCAQRQPKVQITALEIEKKAAQEAQYNFEQSPWPNRLHLYHTDFVTFSHQEKFDVIISNPPFFDETIWSPKTPRNMARHTQNLNLAVLIKKSRRLLSTTGEINLILPARKKESLELILNENKLYIKQLCLIRGRSESKIKRILVNISQKKVKTLTTELIIEKQRHIYTDAYIKLTRDFYLKM